MNDFTLEELAAFLKVFEAAGVDSNAETVEASLYARLQQAHSERAELESMDFDDCVGGACKL